MRSIIDLSPEANESLERRIEKLLVSMGKKNIVKNGKS
jgi:hypothetical protein